MKTITIDLKSFCFGVVAVGTLLLMANKPAQQPVAQNQPDPVVRRYQAVVSEGSRTIIIDTQTGRFLVERPALGLPSWAPQDFEELHRGK